MGSDLSTIVKALSIPFQSAVHECAQISSESDCTFSGCCACHTRTTAPDPDDAEIDIETKDTG